jgi:hypothetical protein
MGIAILSVLNIWPLMTGSIFSAIDFSWLISGAWTGDRLRSRPATVMICRD